MAEVKFIKLNGGDLQQHDPTTDDLTVNKQTADEFSLGGNATLDESTGTVRVRNGANDDFANLEVEGLKVNDDIDANSNKVVNLATPTAGTDGANKDYVDSAIQGIVWQEPIIDELATPPGAPTAGDRYLVIATASGAWEGEENSIAEWDGDAWVFFAPQDGWAVWNQTTNAQKNFNGTAWVAFGSTVNHNNLTGLQGGTTSEYYHLTETEHGAMTGGAESDADAHHTHDSKADTATEIIAGDGLSGGGDLSESRTLDVNVQNSIEIDSTGEQNHLQLVNDEATPGNSKYYGTDGAGAKGFHNLPSGADASTVEVEYTAGAGGVTAGQAVYVSANNTVLPASNAGIATARVIGIAKTTESATDPVMVVVGGMVNAGSGLTAGSPIYLGTGGAVTETPPTAEDSVVVELGIAKNANSIQVNIQKAVILS